MKRSIVLGMAGAVALAAAHTASASTGVTDFSFENVDNGMDGLVTTDLLVHGDPSDTMTSQQLFLELDEGHFWESEVGENGPPNAAFFDSFPELEFDTYVAVGGRTSGEQDQLGSLSTDGGAVDLMTEDERDTHSSNLLLDSDVADGGNDQLISINWFPSTGVEIAGDPDGLFIARITLSEDASGEWRLRSGMDEPEEAFFVNQYGEDSDVFRVENGALIPEPGSLALLGAGAGLMMLRRRK